MSFNVENILVVGLGMIGSSIAFAAKSKGINVNGFDLNEDVLKKAIDENIIDATIESIEEITLVPQNYGKLLRIISNLSIPGTYCFTLLVNIWSDTAHIEALIMTMIPVAVKGLLKFTQDKKNTIKMSNWDEAVKIVYFEDLLSKQ